ncbi:hypothetical protein LCGC14_2445730 [marine sediment metagenome]|uniref:Uncharacterized protein n=1 Tax=marine sediment metagenome TaxID=412755 RepID=A0A0F9C541_9ZZZZ
MSILFSPDGSLNVAVDPSDLPEAEGRSGAMVRCKNMRTNENGKAITRDGSTKLNSSAIETAIWWIEEQAGSRFSFAGTQIYEDESSIDTGLTNAQWAAIKYNAFNDTTDNIFALNGTDRKRIESSTVYEWGIAAPTTAPILTTGQSTGLTGMYNVRYTYLRKVDSVIVAESNPSNPASSYKELTDQSLAVDVADSADSQVTHVRLYRTLAGGVIYYADQDVPKNLYTHGLSQTWEDTEDYFSGDAYKFTITDSTNSTENSYTWEEEYHSDINDSSGYVDGSNWWDENVNAYERYLAILAEQGALGSNINWP